MDKSTSVSLVFTEELRDARLIKANVELANSVKRARVDLVAKTFVAFFGVVALALFLPRLFAPSPWGVGAHTSEETNFGTSIIFVANAARELEILGDFDQTTPGARAALAYDGVEFAFRYCPAGSFTTGNPLDEEGRRDDEEQESVTINEGFWISETETTQEQWDALVVKKGTARAFEGAKLPVESVTWYDCYAYVKRLNELGATPKGWKFALPTNEEWEYACRAGTEEANNDVALDEVAWHGGNSGGEPVRLERNFPTNGEFTIC